MSDYELRAASLPRLGQRVSLRLLQLFGWKMRYKPLPGPHGVAIVDCTGHEWALPNFGLPDWRLHHHAVLEGGWDTKIADRSRQQLAGQRAGQGLAGAKKEAL